MLSVAFSMVAMSSCLLKDTYKYIVKVFLMKSDVHSCTYCLARNSKCCRNTYLTVFSYGCFTDSESRWKIQLFAPLLKITNEA